MNQRVEFLDYLRGIMAIAVLVYHYTVWSDFHYIYPFEQTLSRLGIYAVSAFYVLSGVSLAIVYLKNQVNKQFVSDFTIKRVFRITPLFYLATSLTLLMAFAPAIKNGDFSNIPDLKTIILNFTLLFGWVSPDSYIATGAWSIGNELVFYSFFPLMLFLYRYSTKHYLIFFTVTILITLYTSFFILSGSASLVEQWGIYINPLNQLYLFAGGFLIGALFKRGVMIKKPVLLTILISSIMVFVFIPTEDGDRISLIVGYPKVLLSLSVFSFCVFAAFWGDTKKNFLTTLFKYFGDISYSIYLIHPIVYTALSMVLAVFPIINSRVIYFLVATTITFVVSTLVYFYIEKPFMKLGRNLSSKYKNKNSFIENMETKKTI